MYTQSHATLDGSVVHVTATPNGGVELILSNPVENTVVMMSPAEAHAIGAMLTDAGHDASIQFVARVVADL